MELWLHCGSWVGSCGDVCVLCHVLGEVITVVWDFFV